MKMTRFQKKITHHIKNQENLKLNLKRQLIDANTEVTNMLQLSDKDPEREGEKVGLKST